MLVNGCKHALGTGDLDRPGKTWTQNGIHPVTVNSPPQRGPKRGAAFSSSFRLAAANWYSFSCKVERIKAVIDMKNTWDGKIDCKKKLKTPKKPHHPANRLSHVMPLQHSHETTPPSGSNWMILDAFNSITLRKLDSQIANQYQSVQSVQTDVFGNWRLWPASAMIMNMNSRASALGSCRRNPAVAPYDSLWKPENHGINWINMDKPWSNAECWWIYCTPTVTWNIYRNQQPPELCHPMSTSL